MAPNWLIPLASLQSMKKLISKSGQHLVILLYHGLNNGAPISFIDPLYPSRSVKTFEEDIHFMNTHFEAVSLGDIIERKGVFERPSYHVTFDDGLRSVYDLALPVIEKQDVRASVYLNNDFVDNQGLFYRYKVALLINTIHANKSLTQNLKSFHKASDIKTWLLSLKYSDQKMIDEMANEIGLNFTTFLEKETPYLSSSNILEMQERGIEFGAHSFDHQMLQDNTSEQMQEQIKNSVQDISKKYSPLQRAFAFPFTDANLSSQDLETMRGHTDISFGTAGLKIDEVANHYQRIPMEVGSMDAATIIKTAHAYFYLCKFIGKHKVKRG